MCIPSLLLQIDVVHQTGVGCGLIIIGCRVCLLRTKLKLPDWVCVHCLLVLCYVLESYQYPAGDLLITIFT